MQLRPLLWTRERVEDTNIDVLEPTVDDVEEESDWEDVPTKTSL